MIEPTEETIETVQEVSKSQQVRLIDVFLLGPFMIYMSKAKKPDQTSRAVLAFFGAATIWYNWKNYRTNKERL
jgi:uncharacterized membrane protein